LHVIPIKFTVDNQEDVKDPIGMIGVRLEVETLIIQGLSSQIKNLTKAKEPEAPEEDQENSDFKIEGWMPIGETAKEIVAVTEETNESMKKMTEAVNKLISTASSFTNVASSCQSTESCQHDCKEKYDSNGNCSCAGGSCSPEYLCDISSLESLLSETDKISSDFSAGQGNFIKILTADKIPPNYLKDLYGVDFTKLPKSHIYTDYNEFYKNFNQLISPILAEMGQEITLPTNGAIPFIEFVKRQSDYSRVGFLNCQTTVGTEEDMENIADGISAYKYPYRVDFILTNRISLPIQEDESNLNYYCASTKEIAPQ
jgi:hypothetical protein